MDLAGNGRLYEKAKLPAAYKSDQHKLRRVCILSGCDYLDSLPGVALMTAAKFFDKIQQTEPIDKVIMKHNYWVQKYSFYFLC